MKSEAASRRENLYRGDKNFFPGILPDREPAPVKALDAIEIPQKSRPDI
jgi:hypothetical protein